MQPKTIETLTLDVDQIKKDIESLKAVVDQQERERKKAEIESRISTVKGELDQKMDALKDSSDAAEQEEYEKAETLSKSLTQLSSLVMSILGNAPVQASEETSPAVPEKKEEDKKAAKPLQKDKNVFAKSWDWIKEQGKAVTSGDERKEHPWQNIARVA
ncbi:MAG: hypothetical protein LBG59_09180 [Candidatus Peribacteria bacterium]|nr:hypothetical protein [Candidatus Peribacteria bacterium]